jgi:hypothetical protein
MAKSRVGGSGSRLDGRYSITTPKDGRDRGEPTERCPQYEAQRERENRWRPGWPENHCMIITREIERGGGARDRG